MCTLYNIRTTRGEIASYFEAQDAWRNDLEKDYVATDRPGWVVTESEGGRSLTVMRWGFPPPQAAKGPVVNVRNLSSPFWRTALSKPERRCLVPATSFSEWSARSAETGKATLHWFSVPSRPIFAMAGLWRPTETGSAYAFLTTEPNSIVGAIHPKAMPVILDEADHEAWLRGSFDEACALAQPYPSQLMTMA
jgi:putative SOS response-associated peptidase YedK